MKSKLWKYRNAVKSKDLPKTKPEQKPEQKKTYDKLTDMTKKTEEAKNG